MDDPRQCSQCGAVLTGYALEGVCGNCLLQPGLAPLPELLDEPANEPRFPALSAGSNRASHTEAVGRFGDYELLEEIARGGMGVVYRARQVSLDRIVAVKLLLAGPLATKDFIQRFRTESAAAASLQHPNIVAIHEVGFAEGQHFFAMDYVQGLTLAQLVAQGPLPARRAARYLQTMAEAIQFAHERNVLHRDLKPSNILIDSVTDQPRVTDFGLAKRLEAETELTLTGQVLGSPNFMSPEQATAKRGTVGKRSDIYSLGAILYYLVTGRPPFQGQTLTEVLQQVMNDDPLAPRLLTPRLPQDLETICLKCLEKEPSSRYETAQEFADELSRFLRDEPILARPISRVERGWRWCRRKPALAALGASLIVVFTLGFTGTLWQWRQATRHAQAEAEQRQFAEKNRDLRDQNIYDSDMSLAQYAWDEGDFGRTLYLLEAHRPGQAQKDRREFEWYYLRQLCAGDQKWTSPTHSQPVSTVAFSPDGKRVAVGAAGSPVEIWDCTTEKLVTTLPEENVVSLAFGPDGQTLGVGGQDQVVVWNIETRHALFKLEEPLGRFRIALAPRGSLLVLGKHGGIRIFGQDGGSAELWDYVTHELKCAFPESGGNVALSSGGDKLATGNWEQTIKIWDLATRRLVKSLPAGGVEVMAWSPDGQTLATSLSKAGVTLWDAASGRTNASLANNGYPIWTLTFSPDGRFLVTGGPDQAIHLWDLATRLQTEQLQGHGSGVMSLAFSPDGRTLLSGSKDKTAMLWSPPPNRTLTTVSNVVSWPTFSADSRFIAAGIDRGEVAVWDVARLHVQAVFAGAHSAVAFSTNGSALVTRGPNDFLSTFDVAKPMIRETIPAGPMTEHDAQATLSPDGQILATGYKGRLTLSSSKTGAVIATIPDAFAGDIFQLAFSPNGQLLAVTGRELEQGRVPAAKIWTVPPQQKPLLLLTGHTDSVLGVAFSPDGQMLATCSADNSIKFWNTATGKEILPSLGQKEYVLSVAFSPNGRRLASASTDGTMKIWNVATRREVASLKFEGWPSNITFSPDGQTLAALLNNSLRVWRAPTWDKEPSRSRDE